MDIEQKRQRLRELLGPERERSPDVHIGGDIIITTINDRTMSDRVRELIAAVATRIRRR